MDAHFKQFVVEPLELQQHLDQKEHVILDCRFALSDPEAGRQAYQESHIPGAYYLHLNEDLSGPVTETSGRHPLPEVDQIQEIFSACGIHSGESSVVVYDQGEMAFAARAWWILRYFGHDKVRILNGGFSHWSHLGYPTSDTPPKAVEGQFIAHPQKQLMVEKQDVVQQSQSESGILIDARDPTRYEGKEEPLDPVAGHIPSAKNFPWTGITDEHGFIKPPFYHKERWKRIRGAEPITVYCGSGVTACVSLFSMELANIENAKLYPGSWSEWSKDGSLPVKTGAE